MSTRACKRVIADAWLYSLRLQGMPSSPVHLDQVKAGAVHYLQAGGYSIAGLDFKTTAYKQAVWEFTGQMLEPATESDIEACYKEIFRKFWDKGEATYSQLSPHAAGAEVFLKHNVFLDDYVLAMKVYNKMVPQ